MTSRTRTAKKTAEAAQAPTPAKKATAKRAAAARPPRKRTPRKTTAGTPKLSLVKNLPPLPARTADFMTDTQGYATLAARMVGITTVRIRDWRDHRDNTCTRPLRDGSTLHYDLATRTLTWQAVCPMGAVHQYQLTSPSMAAAARVHADRCAELHADLTTVQPLTADELEALGLLQKPTWAKSLPGEPDFTDTKVVPLPAPEPRERALGDQLAHSGTDTTETQPMSRAQIAEGLAERAAAADTETPKEHPEP